MRLTTWLSFGCVVTIVVAGAVQVLATGAPASIAPSRFKDELVGLDASLVIAVQRIAALETPANLGPGARMVFIGDSLGGNVAKGLVPAAAARGARVVQSTAPGCSTIVGIPMVDGTTIPWGQTCLDYLERSWRAKVAAIPADAVLWLSSLDSGARLVDGARLDPATPDGRAAIAQLIVDTADIVAAPGSGRQVVLLLPAPSSPSLLHGAPNPQSAIDNRRHRAILHLVVQRDPARFSMLPLDRFLCPRGAPCPAQPAPGITPRGADGGHITPEGAAWLAPQILDALGVT